MRLSGEYMEDHEPTFKYMESGHPPDQLLPKYYKNRGGGSEGVPLKSTLAKLGVEV
jgi:aldehyde:ferredoxin oxidoreductase